VFTEAIPAPQGAGFFDRLNSWFSRLWDRVVVVFKFHVEDRIFGPAGAQLNMYAYVKLAVWALIVLVVALDGFLIEAFIFGCFIFFAIITNSYFGMREQSIRSGQCTVQSLRKRDGVRPIHAKIKVEGEGWFAARWRGFKQTWIRIGEGYAIIKEEARLNDIYATGPIWGFLVTPINAFAVYCPKFVAWIMNSMG